MDSLSFTGNRFRGFVAAEAVGVASRAIKVGRFDIAYLWLKRFENDKIDNTSVGSCQYMLGYLFYNGKYVQKDIERAINILQNAAWTGNSDAIEYLRRRSNKITAGYDVENFSP